MPSKKSHCGDHIIAEKYRQEPSVANLAALGCMRFCFLTFVTHKIRLLSERTRMREITVYF